MATFVPYREVEVREKSAVVTQHFRPVREYPVLHCHEGTQSHTNTSGFSYFLIGKSGVVVCTVRGLPAGGAGKSKGSNSFRESFRQDQDSAIRSLVASLTHTDPSATVAAAKTLMANAAGADATLLASVVPALAQQKPSEGTERTEARLAVAQLLRVSAVRCAIHYRAGTAIDVLPLVSGIGATVARSSPEEVDLQAELRAAANILSSLNNEFWKHLETTLPLLANFRNCSDPIEIIGHLVDRVRDLTQVSSEIYKSAKDDSQVSIVMMLTVMRHARKYLSMRDIEVLNTAVERCQVWWIAVLMIRLAAECIEEGELDALVRSKLCVFLSEFLGFKRFYLRNHWKVRRSAMHNLLKVHNSAHDKTLQTTIDVLISERLVLENDPKVKSVIPKSVRFSIDTVVPTIAADELQDLCKNVHKLYGSIHMKDGACTHIIARELTNVEQTLTHLVTLTSGKCNFEEVEKAIIEVWRAKAIDKIVIGELENESSLFVGRQTELQQALELFKETPVHLAVLGPSGVGKSSFARQLLTKLRSCGLFDSYTWLNAENSISLCHSLLPAEQCASQYSAVLAAARNSLRSSGRGVIVYDNADLKGFASSQEIDSFVKALIDLKQASVIVTSRNEEWRRVVPMSIRLTPPNEAEITDILRSLSGLDSAKVLEAIPLLEGNLTAAVIAGTVLQQSKGVVPLETLMSGPGRPIEKAVKAAVRFLSVQSASLANALSALHYTAIPTDLATEIARKLGILHTKSYIAELQSIGFLTTVQSSYCIHPAFARHIDSLYPHLRSDWERVVSQVLTSLLVSTNSDIGTILHCRAYHNKRTERTMGNFTVDQALLTFCLSNGLEAEAAAIGRKVTILPQVSINDKLLLLVQQAEVYEKTENFSQAEAAYMQAYPLAKEVPRVLFEVATRLARGKWRAGDRQSAQGFMEDALPLMHTLALSASVQYETYSFAAEIWKEDPEKHLKWLELATSAGKAEGRAGLHMKVDLAEEYFRCRKEDACLTLLTEVLDEVTAEAPESLTSRVFSLLSQCNATRGAYRLEILQKELELNRDSLRTDKRRLIELLSELSSMISASEFLRVARLYATSTHPQAFPQSAIALIHPKDYQLFDCLQCALLPKVRLSTTVKADHLSTYIILSDGTLFLCGGGEYRTLYDTAYRVYVNGNVQQLMKMVRARQAHGVVECVGHVFTFGGETQQHEPVSHCEKLQLSPLEALSKRKWQKLPNMLSARSCFNPCVFEEMIYLVGGNTDKAEVFDPQSGVFGPLQICLPESEDTCTLLLPGELLVVSSNYLSRWNLQSRQLLSLPRLQWTDAVKKWDYQQQGWTSEPLYIGSMNGIRVEDFIFMSVYDHIRVFDLGRVREHVILLAGS